MKVYRCICHDGEYGNIVTWHASKRKARWELRQWERHRGARATEPEGVERIDIPTDKRGLLEWLNKHFDRGNG